MYSLASNTNSLQLAELALHLFTGSPHPLPDPPPPPLEPPEGLPPHPLFAVEQLGVDRRLLLNRKRQLKMFRVWVQGKFRKL